MSLLAALCAVALAADGSTVTVDGAVQSDVRYRLFDVPAGTWYQPLTQEAGFVRNENLLSLDVRAADPRGRVAGRVDLDLALLGFAEQDLDLLALTDRDRIHPFRLDAHAAFLEVRDLGLEGLDLRLGQQLVQWGKADQFNPTNNLNADDLEDPLRFGDQTGNLMARLDYSPRGNWTLTAVGVPLFKPALVPASAPVGFAFTERLPWEEDELRWRIQAEQAFARDFAGYPTVVQSAVVELPEPSLENAQVAVQVGGFVGLHDVAVSYYRGRYDFPVPVQNLTRQVEAPACNPDEPDDCIDGLLETEVTLAYPRMQVFGFNASGEVPLGRLPPPGYFIEVAAILPEETRIALLQDNVSIAGVTVDGEYPYPWLAEDAEVTEADRPVVVPAGLFLKWTVGFDYTFGRHVYLNAQWVHGLPDELGRGDWLWEGFTARGGGAVFSDAVPAGVCATFDETPGERCATEWLRSRIGDYAVIGTDLLFGATTLRLFGLVDLTGVTFTAWDEANERRTSTRYGPFTPEGYSATVYPELMHNLGNGVTLSAGALVLLGPEYSKFGDPAAGGTQVFVRGRYAF